VFIFKRELEWRAKRRFHDGGGTRKPPPLNIAPTKREDVATSGAEGYDLKYAIKKAGPFLTLPFNVRLLLPISSLQPAVITAQDEDDIRLLLRRGSVNLVN
jgi:hypothetical protein